jgi:hypothetical protein
MGGPERCGFFAIITKITLILLREAAAGPRPGPLGAGFLPRRAKIQQSLRGADGLPADWTNRTSPHSTARPGVSWRQALSCRSAGQTLGIPSGKNFDLSWDFQGHEKSCPDTPVPG